MSVYKENLQKRKILLEKSRKEKALELIQAVKCRHTYKPYSGLQKSLRKILKPFSRKFGICIGDFQAHWPSLAGDKLASQTLPVRIETYKGQKTLFVQTSSASAFLMQMETPRILERINLMLGANNIQKIRLTQSHKYTFRRKLPPNRTQVAIQKEKTVNVEENALSASEKRNLTQGLHNVTDNTLKISLKQLGENVFLRAKRQEQPSPKIQHTQEKNKKREI